MSGVPSYCFEMYEGGDGNSGFFNRVIFGALGVFHTGSPYMIEDPVTHEPYTVGAGGKFYVNIIRNDNGETANKFYLECLSQGRDADQASICAYLKPAFETSFGAKIQEYIVQQNKSLSNYVGLQPSELLAISKELFPRMKYVFEKFGLELVDESDEAMLSQLVVNHV